MKPLAAVSKVPPLTRVRLAAASELATGAAFKASFTPLALTYSPSALI